MKECSKCHETKELTEFYKNQNQCKICRCEYNKHWYKTPKGKSTYTKNARKWKTKLQGVYGIYTDGECVYVGESKRLNDRMSSHRTLSRNYSYARPYFQPLYQYLSTVDFTIKILEETPNHKEREQYWINKLKPKYNA
jgi:hypothetical protein